MTVRGVSLALLRSAGPSNGVLPSVSAGACKYKGVASLILIADSSSSSVRDG
jgi:hypothetical protein